MKRIFVVGVLTVSLALTAALAWSQTKDAPATLVNRDAAVEAFRKARDLFQAEKYAEAAVENEKALKLDPTYADAQTLKRILDSRIATAAPATATTTAATTAADKRLLKPSDISLIRIFELSLQSPDDQKIKGRIDRKVLEKFWDEVVRKDGNTVTPDAKAKFLQPGNFLQQVQQIRDSGDQAYMEKIEFTSDPIVMLNFKKTVQPFVLQNCATANCHGGDKAGNLRLFRTTTSDRETYTNFYILSHYTFNGNKLIDRENPEKSLVLQFPLAKNVATATHPKRAIPHRFADTNNPNYRDILNWITGDPARNIPGLAFPQPNYGIVYELPAK
ncbi:MAG: hypothetical protein FWD53_05360 [Phycisphaerales bacterium]|nr:hypothetical protein [Phycisphaerales bacterium]